MLHILTYSPTVDDLCYNMVIQMGVRRQATGNMRRDMEYGGEERGRGVEGEMGSTSFVSF